MPGHRRIGDSLLALHDCYTRFFLGCDRHVTWLRIGRIIVYLVYPSARFWLPTYIKSEQLRHFLQTYIIRTVLRPELAG